jgi:hypothetical protein
MNSPRVEAARRRRLRRSWICLFKIELGTTNLLPRRLGERQMRGQCRSLPQRAQNRATTRSIPRHWPNIRPRISSLPKLASSDLGLVASNAFHYFFKLAAYRRLRMARLFPNRDFQISKLFIDIDELETNLSTECIYMRTHGEPLAGMHPTPPALLCRVETATSEARQICENSCKAIGQAHRTTGAS